MQPLTAKNQTNQMIIFLWCASSNHHEQMQDFKHKRRDYSLVLVGDLIQALETSTPPSSVSSTCAQPPTVSPHLLLSHGPPCRSLDCALATTLARMSPLLSLTTKPSPNLYPFLLPWIKSGNTFPLPSRSCEPCAGLSPVPLLSFGRLSRTLWCLCCSCPWFDFCLCKLFPCYFYDMRCLLKMA
jgi:hypothetical protein